jgi:hypothetical protein
VWIVGNGIVGNSWGLEVGVVVVKRGVGAVKSATGTWRTGSARTESSGGARGTGNDGLGSDILVGDDTRC